MYTSQIDIRLFHAFYEHKKMMSERFAYFETNNIYHIGLEISEILASNTALSRICEMLSLKYNLSSDPDIIKNIISRLEIIEENEKYVYEKILL